MRPGLHNLARVFGIRRGQAMIESCFVIIFLCLLFVALFQLIHASVAREVLYRAAACAARARTVGLNRDMVTKTMLAAAIPNAGALTQPAISSSDPTLANALATFHPVPLWDLALRSSPTPPTLATELARIPEFMASASVDNGKAVLDYENWDGGNQALNPPTITVSGNSLSAQVTQSHGLLLNIAVLQQGNINSSDPRTVNLTGSYAIEAHYPLYLDDKGL